MYTGQPRSPCQQKHPHLSRSSVLVETLLTKLGFPSIQLSTEIAALSWDASVYTGLHPFHKAKGFDPDSLDVARYFEHELYQLSSEVEAAFAHIESTPTNCDSPPASQNA